MKKLDSLKRDIANKITDTIYNENTECVMQSDDARSEIYDIVSKKLNFVDKLVTDNPNNYKLGEKVRELLA